MDRRSPLADGPSHGVAHTHLDSLAHINESGVFFNGYKPDSEAVIKANHHFKNSIHNLKDGIVTRGVLMDIPRLKAVMSLATRASEIDLELQGEADR